LKEKGNSPQNVKPVTSLFHCADPRDHECPISAYICRFYSYISPMLYNPTQVFMHYVFTKILRYSYAALDCASMKANILHVQKCSDRLPSLSTSGASADVAILLLAAPPFRST
ncbi:hypothetical protein T07_14641, partial [Trichinella nelsoni]